MRVFTADLRAQVEAKLAAPLVEKVFAGLEGEVALVPASTAVPTPLQRAQAISEHIEAVGKIGLSAYEVALTLDSRHPGMTDKEFAELQSELQPEIQAARSAGLHAIWG